MGRPSRYSPEVRERAVRMVFEHQREYDFQWRAMASIVSKIGCTAETLRKWVRKAERDAGHSGGLTTEEKQRMKELEREFTVLDPACGSGNFLYLALHALKNLEHQFQLEAEAMGLQRAFPSVGPAKTSGGSRSTPTRRN